MAVMPIASNSIGVRLRTSAGGSAGAALARQRAMADLIRLITGRAFAKTYSGNLMRSSTAPMTLLRTCINIEKDRLACWLDSMAPTRSSLLPLVTSAASWEEVASSWLTLFTASVIDWVKVAGGTSPYWLAAATLLPARFSAALVSDARSVWIKLAIPLIILPPPLFATLFTLDVHPPWPEAGLHRRCRTRHRRMSVDV